MKSRWIILPALLVGLAAGYLLRGGHPHDAPSGAAPADADAPSVWTCSMHPQIRQPSPGLCPLCAMDLIPVVADGGADLGPREIELSASAQRLARVETAPVERRALAAQIQMVGKLAYDETRLRDVTLLSDGQVRRLFINYIGVPVRADDHLAEIYSPDVFAASRELVVAARAPGSETVVQAAQQKLRLLGVGAAQIDEILSTGQATDTYVLHSAIDGHAVAVDVKEGGWMQRGGRLAQLADPSVLWARLDAYEKDAPFLHYGQQVELTVEALPGRTFTGFVAFIPPEMDDETRTLPVRLNVPNPDGLLKPGMFVRARLNATFTADGREIAPGLAGKWISPMHPEIVRDEPGPCPVCGMALVTSESLGFVAGDPGDAPLVIPASAPLITGRRAVVYVADPEREGVYEGRVVELGPRLGDFYVVNEGLVEGESVVVQGNLQIDSAIQILAKPSMMNPEGGGPIPGHHHGDGRGHEHEPADPAPPKSAVTIDIPPDRAGRILPDYLAVQEALAADDLDAARAGLRAMMDVTGHHGALPDLIHDMLAAETLDAMRRPHFETLSNAMITALRGDPPAFEKPLFLMNCPMVYDDRGADWLQRTDTLANPYFGATMLRCGTVEEEWK